MEAADELPVEGPPTEERGEVPGEGELWSRWKSAGDDIARKTLLELHLPYARVMAAMAFRHRITDAVAFDDYLQLARIGLLEAFERFDPSFGVRFRTFAARRVRGAILDGLEQLTERQSQVGARRKLLADRTDTLVAEAGPVQEGASADELLRYLAEIGMGLAVSFMLDGTGMVEPGEGSTAEPDPPYRAAEMRSTRRQLLQIIDALAPQERIVIRDHYLQGVRFDEIARSMGLTKGRISQIHKKALESLRTALKRHVGIDRSV